jgi:rRNA maturation endonuclease Nob1
MPPNNQSRYEVGQKRCTKCSIFLEYAGLWCPCCGFRLRIHRRSSKDKLKVRAEKDKREASAIYN